MQGEGVSTPASGWGPVITIESTRSTTKEVIHGHSADFVLTDYPSAFNDRVAIHRKGARYDAAGAIFVEFPVGAGPQMATFLRTFVHLPGALPRRLRPTRAAIEPPPSALARATASLSSSMATAGLGPALASRKSVR